MSDWILNLPVLWMGVLILAGTYVVTAGIYLLVTKLAVADRAVAFKSISPGILPPLAIIFALLVGFLAAQDWNENERASSTVNREASALRAVVLLAAAFPGSPSRACANSSTTTYRTWSLGSGRRWPGMMSP